MSDLPYIPEARLILGTAGIELRESDDFEAVYDDLASTGGNEDLLRALQECTRKYFAAIEIPETATVYDYLLLSLRPKDLIATFNWDPLLAQAFRRHEGRISMPMPAFLHGNVSVGFCEKDRQVGWHDDHCMVCGGPLAPSPLLFPIRNKDYASQASIRSQWALLERHLERAYFVTIFGYSAPVTDAAARELMLNVWRRNTTRQIGEVEIINIAPREVLRETWKDFISETREHYLTNDSVMRAYTSWHPRRSCDALFAATMLCEPFKDDYLPELPDPNDLRRWVAPLWREERDLKGSAEKYFSGRPCREWHEQESASRGASSREEPVQGGPGKNPRVKSYERRRGSKIRKTAKPKAQKKRK
jgi:hypothetical protein